jgi:hypothetical protein
MQHKESHVRHEITIWHSLANFRAITQLTPFGIGKTSLIAVQTMVMGNLIQTVANYKYAQHATGLQEF